MEGSCSVHHTITVESQLQLDAQCRIKMPQATYRCCQEQSMTAIYIPGFCRLRPEFNSGPKGLMTKQNLNFYFCYMKKEILQRRHMKLAGMS